VLLGYARALDFGRLTFRAPWLDYGAYTENAVGGTLFQVAYTLRRPGTVTATLRLADGRQLAMTVNAGSLEVLLPPDAPAGPATVLVDLVDADGVTGHADLTVQLSGVPLPGGGPRSAGMSGVTPADRTAPRTRTISAPADPVRVIVGAGAVRRQGAVRTTRDTEIAINLSVGRGVARLRRSPHVRARSEEIAVKLAARPGTLTGTWTLRRVERVEVNTGETAVVRRDGPAIEEALLLGLL
jgi:hypothetical protein